MKKYFLTAAILLVCLTTARAESRPVLAVMPFQPLANVSPNIAAEFTGYFSEEIRALEYADLIESARIEQLYELRRDGYCAELACAVNRGKALQADLVVFGTVKKEGEVYILKTSLVTVASASLVDRETTIAEGSTRGTRVKGAEMAALDLVGDLALKPAGGVPPPTPGHSPGPATAPESLMYTPRKELAGRQESPGGVRPSSPPFLPDVRVGLKAGLALAGLYGGSAGNWDGRTGFTGGVFLRWIVNESFTIQPELLYTMKGAEYSENYQGSTLDITLEMNYLEIPILAKYAFPLEWKVKPHLFAGPSIGIKIGDNLEARYKGQSTAIPDSVADLNSFEFGFVVGGGVDIPLGSGLINLDIRYCPSLTSAFSGGDEKNSVWEFTAGYVF